MAQSIPPAVLNVIQALPEETQAKVIQYGARAAMDPWFVPLASVPLAFAAAYVPHGIKLGIVLPYQMFSYDNENPRQTNWRNVFSSFSSSSPLRTAGTTETKN